MQGFFGIAGIRGSNHQRVLIHPFRKEIILANSERQFHLFRNQFSYQVASDAGFRLPPVGQDIGTEVPTNELKPGNVIMGANNQNGVFLGVGDDGQALAINENGEVKPLHEIAKWDGGPHQGFFKLADDGAPTPAVQEAAGHQPAAPPAPGNPAPPPPSTVTA